MKEKDTHSHMLSIQSIPYNKQLGLLTHILTIMMTRYHIFYNALEVPDINVTNVNDLFLSGVKHSRSTLFVNFSSSTSDTKPREIGRGSKCPTHPYIHHYTRDVGEPH